MSTSARTTLRERFSTAGRVFAAAAGGVAAAGLAAILYVQWRRAQRTRRNQEQLSRWCEEGPANEPTIDCEVPIAHGLDGVDPEIDAVEVPVGLIFECERLRSELRDYLKAEDDETMVEVLQKVWDEDEESAEAIETLADSLPTLRLPWLDLAALAQLTYWYDRRPQSEAAAAEAASGSDTVEARPTDAKFGRWTKKLSREKVVYGTVALRYRTRGHLGQQVFRRPAGIDVTRLSTLQRAAALCGHAALLTLVEGTMRLLRPENVAKIPWDEVKRHTSKDDVWLLIDGKVYDVTPFLDLHPGGGQLIVEASGHDATSAFERTHGEGLRYSLRLLNQFFIGECVGHAEAPPADPAPTTPEFLATMRSITGALHTFDEAKATGEAQGLLR